MPLLRLRPLRCLAILSLAGPPARAEDASSLDDATLDRMILGIDPWDDQTSVGPASSFAIFQEGDLTLSTGWRENVLFAPEGELASAYSRVEVDWSAFALPYNERWSAFVSVQAEMETFHHHREQLDDQGFAVAVLGGEVRPVPELKLGLTGQAAYSDQYFGVAVTDILTESVRIVSTQWSLRPQATWQPAGRWRLGASAPLEWDEFDPASENYAQSGLAASFGWHGERLECDLSHTRSVRDYDEREYRTSFGFNVVGSRLRWLIDETRLAARLRIPWDAERAWRLRASLGWRTVADGEQGYDDHARGDVRAGLAYEGPLYDAELDLTYSLTEYDVQRISLLDPTLRAQQSGSVELRAGRRLSGSWRVVAALRWEDLASNRTGDDYTVQSARLGLSWNISNL